MGTEKDKAMFVKCVSEQTILTSERALELYSFCENIGLSAEDVIKKFGNTAKLHALFGCMYLWHQKKRERIE